MSELYDTNDPNYEVTETELGTRIKHPSYATMAFSRRTHGKSELFGSSIHHRDTITCTIREASITRGLNNDWITGDSELIEVEMSYSQFAEAITSMNMGSGVPVTLKFIRGKGRMPECKFTDKRALFEEELRSNLDEYEKDASDKIAEISTIIEKKSLTKADKELIMSTLHTLESRVKNQTQFAFSQFQEQIDKTVSEAKGEVEAFVQNKMNQIATTALSNTLEKNDENKLALVPKDNPIDM